MTTIQVRRGTAAQWASAATVLAAGELGLDATNNILKLGDGSTAWASLQPVLNGTYASLNPQASSYTYNSDGTVATETVAGVTTTYTYNADGTVATSTRSGVTRAYTYNTDGTLASVA